MSSIMAALPPSSTRSPWASTTTCWPPKNVSPPNVLGASSREINRVALKEAGPEKVLPPPMMSRPASMSVLPWILLMVRVVVKPVATPKSPLILEATTRRSLASATSTLLLLMVRVIKSLSRLGRNTLKAPVVEMVVRAPAATACTSPNWVTSPPAVIARLPWVYTPSRVRAPIELTDIFCAFAESTPKMLAESSKTMLPDVARLVLPALMGPL